jgi:putative DNA primase/helicase
MLDARTVAHALGGEVRGRNEVIVPGPAHSPRDRSLSIKLDPNAPDGFLVFSHSGDCWQDCRDHVRRKLGLPDWQPGDGQNRRIPTSQTEKWDSAMTEEEANAQPRAWNEDELLRINGARRIWEEGTDPRQTLAERYLRQHRRLELTDELAGNVLRFHPACPWRDENTGQTINVPALIAAFRSIHDDNITGIHRIRLNTDASKHDRRMLGCVKHAAVKLAPITSGNTLAIGEGIETCMAAQQLGFKPAWALGSVGAISFFPVINSVKQLYLLGESGNASARAAEMCAPRWKRRGRRVQVVTPDIGDDINDAIIIYESKKLAQPG